MQAELSTMIPGGFQVGLVELSPSQPDLQKVMTLLHTASCA